MALWPRRWQFTHRHATLDSARVRTLRSYSTAIVKTVWIVGAGISKAAGYPLVRDFLDKQFYHRLVLFERAAGRDTSWLDAMLQRVDRWSATGKDLNAVMSDVLGSGDADEIHDLNAFVLNVLDTVRWIHHDQYNLPYLQAFAQQLGATDSTLITFNYDTLIEEQLTFAWLHAMRRQITDESEVPYSLNRGTALPFPGVRRFLQDYGSGFLPSYPPCGAVQILKLHGSTDLLYCRRCFKIWYLLPPSDSVDYALGRSAAGRRVKCPCGDTTPLQMLFVPPAADGTFAAWPALESVWQMAECELGAADIIVASGYSLPSEDARARQMLRQVVIQKPDIPVLVVDAFPDESFVARWHEVAPHAIIVRSSFDGLLGFLTRMRSSDTNTYELPDHLAVLLRSLVGAEAARAEVIPGILPITTVIEQSITDMSINDAARASAIAMLGLTKSKEIFRQLWTCAWSGAEPLVRGQCTKALGTIATQTALNELGPLIERTKPLDIEGPTTDGNLRPPVSQATFALAGVRHCLTVAPQLDYREIYEVVAFHLVNESFEYLDAMTAMEILRLIENRSLLLEAISE